MTEHDILTDAEKEALQEVMQTPASVSSCVLIVEDDPVARELLAEFLELNAIECLKASNEEEALAMLAAGQPINLMLTDLRMLPHDGLHLIRKVRESERAALPIIIMSGDANVRDAIDAMHLSVVDFLLKPIDTDKLLKLIRQELGI
jgi:two-component system, OmpR family, response regulator